jgi:ABC-type multidrug transport system fused ATPase/permease subunit
LFSGDIRENVFYGFDTSTYSERELQKMLDDACKQASANFVHDKNLFPDGYNTIVGERGVKLSGG